MFTFFDHTGDIGIDIDAPDPGTLLLDAACAFTETITDSTLLAADDAAELAFTAETLDLLLVDWLSELLYRFETTWWLPRHGIADAQRTDDGWTVRARLSGSRLDPGRHDVRVTVKAVTYHALEVRQTATGWHARVILDV
ncbi:MAG TPA: archease [Vicinamibacterales bacterium]|nr:archease [Vicinamibacterales bacterium]